MDDLVHGRDYLNDWYAILGIEDRNADQNAIHLAYRRKRLAWNTDVVNGLAPEIVQKVTDQARLIGEAYAAIGDPVSRAAYDAQFAAWTGPISTTGLPVEDPLQERLDLEPLLFGRRYSGAAVARAEDEIGRISGFDEETFEVLEEIVLRGNPSDKQRAAYRKALFAHQRALTLKESLAWTEIGFKGRVRRVLGTAELACAAEEIDASRALIEAQGASISRQLAAGDLKLLAAPEGAASGEEVALPVSPEEFVAAALGRFDEGAAKVRDVQREKAALLQKRLRALEVRYVGDQPVLFDDFIIGLRFHGRIDAAVRLHADGLTIHIQGLTGNEHEACEDPEKAREMFLSGVNVLVVELEDGLNVEEELQRAAIRHLAKKLNIDEESLK